MLGLWDLLQARFSAQDGATMVEYGLVVALIALVALLSVAALGDKVLAFFQSVSF